MSLETRHTHDALVINVKQIKGLIERDDSWLIHIEIEIPKKPQNSIKIKTASYDVAKIYSGRYQ